MRVTIGVPFYNVGETLLDCVRSIFAQTELQWELLLVDDGSTDNSLAIARSIDDPRVRVVSDGRNCGLSARLNQIAELAQGEFVARQDADDLMHPVRLAEQVAHLDSHRHVDAVGCPWFAINDNSEVAGICGNRILDLRPESVVKRVPLSHATALGRREWFRRIPYVKDLRRSQDRDFWIRAILFEKSRVALLEKPRYFYRIPESVPLAKTMEGYRNNRRLLRQHGPTQLGRWRTMACICESYAKTALWQLASPTRVSKWLSSARSAPIDKHEQRIAQQVLDHIRAQPVPRTSSLPGASLVGTLGILPCCTHAN